MKIEELYIAEFGALRDLTISLHPDFQIIEGENESGKTTVAAFIRYMLYGFSGKGEAGNLERRRRLTADTHCAKGRMTVSLGKRRFRIERKTTAVLQNGRETYRESSALYDEESGLPVDTRLSIGEYLLGVPENVYTSTAFIASVSELHVGGADMRDAIEQIMFSGNERIHVQQALDRLDEARRSLLHKNEKGGAIFELRKQADELTDALEASHDASRRATALDAALARANENKQEAVAGLQKLRELETAYRDLSLIRRYDALHTLETQAEVCRADALAFREKHTVCGFFPDTEYLNELSLHRHLMADAARQYDAAARQLKKAEEETTISPRSVAYIKKAKDMGGFQAVRENAAALTKGHASSLAGSVVALCIAAVCTLLAILSLNFNPAFSLAFFFIVAAALASSFIWFRGARRQANALLILCRDYGTDTRVGLRSRLQELETERERAEQRDRVLSAAETVAENCRQRCAETLAGLSAVAARWGRDVDPSRMNDLLDELEGDARAAIDEEARLCRQRDALFAEICREREALSSYNEVAVRALVSPTKRQNLLVLEKEGRIGEIDRGIHFYSRQLDILDQRIHQLELDHASAAALIGTPAALAARLDDLHDQIDRMLVRHDAYVAAYNAIANAGACLRARIAPKLTDYAQRLMSNATDGKHNALNVTANLSLTVTDEEGTRSVDHLSGATMDDACIALRLALVSLLFKEKPPVCYDESFVHQDADRTATLLKALADIGKEEDRQQIVFTCHAREEEILSSIGVPHAHLRLTPLHAPRAD